VLICMNWRQPFSFPVSAPVWLSYIKHEALYPLSSVHMRLCFSEAVWRTRKSWEAGVEAAKLCCPARQWAKMFAMFACCSPEMASIAAVMDNVAA
jgi:hypothetical protein